MKRPNTLAGRFRALALPVLAFVLLVPACSSLTTRIESQSDPTLQASPNQVTDAQSSAIESLAEQVCDDANIVGMAVVCCDALGITNEEYLGFENAESGQMTSELTLFRWASISKPLTAVAAMSLWERGEVDLDADIRTIAPEYPDKGFAISLRQLLTHQGGIAHYPFGSSVFDGEQSRPYADVCAAVPLYSVAPLVARPGEKYSYSTQGYMLAGCVMQHMTEQEYAEIVRTRIVEPLKLTTLQPDYQWKWIDHRACGYRKVLGIRFRSGNSDVSWKLPGGGWISSARDLSTFAVGLMNDSLVTRSTRDLMWSNQPSETDKSTPYGIGFWVRKVKGQKVVGHGGAQQKASCILVIKPDSNIGVAIMTNTEGVSGALYPLALKILDVLSKAD